MENKNINTQNNISLSNSQNLKVININEIEGSTFKTKKKSFISEINPHMVRRNIQKEQYVWFGVYDDLTRNKLMINNMKKCKDSSFPLECASIHLEKYKVSFCKPQGEKETQSCAYLIECQGSVIFLKLYLIAKEQMLDLIESHYGVNINQDDRTKIFTELNQPEQIFQLENSNKKFNEIKCVGELDNILIYSLTCNSNIKLEPSSPDTEYMRNIYLGLKKSFYPYSEYLIMYYVYRLEGVRNFYTINQLKECFFKININSTGNSSIETKLSNLEKLTLEKDTDKFDNLPLNTHVTTHNNTNSNSPNRKDNETLKCSTCNASQFVGTPEKDHLNNYSYIFDLHYLPVFDENTGEFFWTNNEANWRTARDSILKSEEINNGKSLSLNHGSLVSLSSSFVNPLNKQMNTEEDLALRTEEKWIKFKNDASSGTFIEELNNLLKDFEK